jgi:hypothetical protein
MVLDIIHLRAPTAAVNIVLDLLAANPWVEGDLEICVYQGDGLPGDVSVHVIGNDTDGPSPVAEQLANELRAFGLVQLTRWIPVTGKKRSAL